MGGLFRSATTRSRRSGIKQAPHYTNGWGLKDSSQDPESLLPQKGLHLHVGDHGTVGCHDHPSEGHPSLVISFCDNRAGISALLRGFGKDPAINRILTLAWRLVHFNRWHLHMEWVASDNNISDKVSRHDLEMAEEFGWQQITADMDPF